VGLRLTGALLWVVSVWADAGTGTTEEEQEQDGDRPPPEYA